MSARPMSRRVEGFWFGIFAALVVFMIVNLMMQGTLLFPHSFLASIASQRQEPGESVSGYRAEYMRPSLQDDVAATVVRNVSGGTLCVAPHATPVAWSPTEDLLLLRHTEDGDRYSLLDLRAGVLDVGEMRLSESFKAANAVFSGFSADGREVAFESADGAVTVVSAARVLGEPEDGTRMASR